MTHGIVWQSLVELVVIVVGGVATSLCALWYFRRVRLDRPAIGTFNGRDIGVIFGFILVLPVLYLSLPRWALTTVLVFTFTGSLAIGFRPLVRPALLWLGIGLLIGSSIFISRTMMGTVVGWQLWWAVDSILVLLGATAVANLYVQGGMSLRLVSWFGLGIGAYDAFFISSLPLTNKLTEKFLGFPLDPSLGMRVGLYNFSLGIGDVLVFSMFLIACYKAYGGPAARLALALIVVFGTVAPSLAPLVINFVDARTDLIVPAQTFFGPAAFLAYVWLRRRYGRERTTSEYLASADASTPASWGEPRRTQDAVTA